MIIIVLLMLGVSSTVDSAYEEPIEYTPESGCTTYREIIADVSAYTSSEGGSIGAWGDELREGYAASDDIPKGTIVIVEGREYIIMDCFGGDYVNRLDLYFGDDEEAAWEFGRKTLVIKVIER